MGAKRDSWWFVVALALQVSCGGSANDGPDASRPDAVPADASQPDAHLVTFPGEAPDAFLRAYGLEAGIGAWSGYDPYFYIAVAAITAAEDRYQVLAIHNADDYAIQEANDRLAELPDFSGYPYGFIDGAGDHAAYLGTELSSRLGQASASCGLAIDAEDIAGVTVYARCSTGQAPPPLTLSVWLVESGLSGDQVNYFSDAVYGGSGPDTNVVTPYDYDAETSPIVGHTFDNVVRDFVTAGIWGEDIDLSSGAAERTFALDMAACSVAANCKVVAFLSEKVNDKAVDRVNLRSVKVGEQAGWLAPPQ
ncbi:MAG: Omp28-related outer membrane protein [Planctomycetales bacterium]|nr:Omp28-related outer membrane protein [Planctomycetales bacterium]